MFYITEHVNSLLVVESDVVVTGIVGFTVVWSEDVGILLLPAKETKQLLCMHILQFYLIALTIMVQYPFT